MGKWDSYHQWLRNSGTAALIQSCYDAYYSFDNGGFDIVKSPDGSNAKMKVQHLKSLVGRVHSLVTQAKLQFDPKAINSNSSSQITSDFARGLLEYYAEDKDMTSVVSSMVMRGLLSLDSYVYAPWSFSKGEPIRPGIMSGDQEFHVMTRFDVASHVSQQDSSYYIVRQLVNKFDLAAQYPQYENEIISAGTKDVNQYIVTPTSTLEDDEDLVETYTLIHAKTLSMPKGRLTVICNNEVLQDSEMPYREVPIVRFSPAKVEGANLGDSPITSLVALQSGIDALYSAVLSNNLNYARVNIWSPSAIQVEPLSEGFNNIVSAQKPEALQLVASSPETYNLIQTLQAQQQLLSGVNSSARGAPEASLKSGNSLALMLSVAVSFADDTQKSYAAACGKLASIVIANLQQFATEPRLAYIGGSSRKSQARMFKADDLEGIARISCSIGNPLTQNIAGRYELVQQWQQYGIVKDPKQIVEFLRTGQLDSLTEDDFKDSMLVRLENEAILRGEVPPVMVTDLHPQHILEHKSVANDPEARKDPKLMEALNQHLLAHIDQIKGMDPDLAAILGLAPLPSMQQPPAPPATDKVPMAPDPAGMSPTEQPLPNLPKQTPEEFQ
jgi:hypothetical protein